MTVSIVDSADSYVSDGTTAARSIGFQLLDGDHLAVWVDDVEQVNGADFTVTGDVRAGTATFAPVAAWPLGAAVRYRRITPPVCAFAGASGYPLPMDSLITELDRQALVNQEQNGEIARVLKVPIDEVALDIPAVAARAGKYLAFDASGNAVAASGSGASADLRVDLAAPGGVALVNGAATVVALSASSGSSLVGFIHTGTGAVARTVQSKLRAMATTPADRGAIGDGSANDYAPFNNTLSAFNRVHVPTGIYKIGTQKLGEFQKPLVITGDGSGTVIIPDNTDKTAFRVGAVGGSFGDIRAPVRFSSMTFKAPASAVAPYAYTGIDLQATFPATIDAVTMIDMGPGALKIKSCFYGTISGLWLTNSGMLFDDVNVIGISGFDIRANENDDPSRGADLFGDVSRYPVELIESDLIKFRDGTIEGWKCPAVLLRRAYTTVYDGVWFEGNDSATHIIKMEQSQTLNFNNCQLDFAIPYTDCFIKIDNSTPGADENVRWKTGINITGGYLLITSTTYGDAPHLVKVTTNENARVLIDGGTAFRGGPLYAGRTVEFDVRSIHLTGAHHHSFYSRPNAQLLREYNSWVPQSVSSDWDFAATNITAVSGGLTVTATTTAGDFITGSRAVKVTGIASDAAQKQVKRNGGAQLPALSVQGQTYLMFVRIKCDRDVAFNLDIDGGFVNFGQAPPVDIRANEWYDFVLKTGEDVSWAQGRFTAPDILINVRNSSGASATLYIDRLDYAIVTGDHTI